ncbi:hypothetical protein [Microbacterium sp. NPDC077184]|uniref:hypothetical protein n=1 Tax=Microbacterium sp. NPDC077184 TaxID=3154764 RepID=UPI00343250F4
MERVEISPAFHADVRDRPALRRCRQAGIGRRASRTEEWKNHAAAARSRAIETVAEAAFGAGSVTATARRGRLYPETA